MVILNRKDLILKAHNVLTENTPYVAVIKDGYTVYTSKEIKSFYSDNKSLQKIESYRGYFIINFENENVRLGNGKTGLFPKRAILRIGMLLRDSEVAKEVRTQLLNIII